MVIRTVVSAESRSWSSTTVSLKFKNTNYRPCGTNALGRPNQSSRSGGPASLNGVYSEIFETSLPTGLGVHNNNTRGWPESIWTRGKGHSISPGLKKNLFILLTFIFVFFFCVLYASEWSNGWVPVMHCETGLGNICEWCWSNSLLSIPWRVLRLMFHLWPPLGLGLGISRRYLPRPFSTREPWLKCR